MDWKQMIDCFWHIIRFKCLQTIKGIQLADEFEKRMMQEFSKQEPSSSSPGHAPGRIDWSEE